MPKEDKIIRRAVEIPDFLVGEPLHLQEAYVEWVKIDEQIKTHKNRFIDIRHPDDESKTIEIDLIQAYPSVRNKIAHLPEKDQTRIKDKWSEIQSLKSRKGRLKVLWSKKKYNGKNSGVLDIKATEILELFGQWRTIDEVYKVVVHDWNYSEITRDELYKFSVANKNKIAKLREKWENGFNDHFITKKRGRIQTLSYLLATQQDKYEIENHPISRSKEIRGILDQAKKEIEGDRIAIDINGQINVDLTLQLNKSMKKISQQLSINRIIVGMVAARLNIPPELIIAQLERSFYSKYSGITGVLSGDEDQDENYHPSKLIYDWQLIEKKNKEKVEEAEYQMIEIDVEESKKKVVENKRQKLLELLEKKEEKLGTQKRD